MRLRPARAPRGAPRRIAVAVVILLSAGMFGGPTSTVTPARLPTATLGPLTAAASPIPLGTTQTGLISFPQGCMLSSVSPHPPDIPIFSARSYAGAQGEVALTFDDGPIPHSTRRILDELKAAGAQATFFVEGAKARRYPDVVRAELAGGNAVGNHTYMHLSLPGARLQVVQDQLHRTTSTIESITGDHCLWLFRPPYGHLDARVLAEAHREGLTTVLWDVEAEDWLRAVIEQRIISQLHSGAIILLHDWVPGTVAALPAILAAMRARGLRAVTLPQLLRDAGLTGPRGAASYANSVVP